MMYDYGTPHDEVRTLSSGRNRPERRSTNQMQAKIMAKATETGNVCECAANEMLRTSLPVSTLKFPWEVE